MRILQLIPDMGTGGAERTTVDVAEAIVAAGGQAHVWTSGGRLVPALNAAGARVHIADAATKSPWQVLQANPGRLENLIRQYGIELVHARSRAPAWSGLIAARRSGVPFVTTYHGIYNGRSGLKRWYNGVMARGDLVIANSQFTADHVISTHGVAPDRLRVIPRGVDLDRFDRDAVTPDRVAALRASWLSDAPADLPVIMLPGRLTAWKGQLVLIEALARLAGQGRAAIGLLVGDDQGRHDYTASLKTAIARHGLEGNVRLVGHCDDMPAALLLADVVACPSTDPEAFGRTAAEAGAMGVPVVAAAHGGALEVIAPGDTGLLVAPGDSAALAGALEQLLAMPVSERETMGIAAMARVRSTFSKQSLQSQTLGVYRELLREAGH
ncbi:MAG: glycosyltransferase family 4 protein [Hyphomonadaceae bacterium]|jgi:glycosyltransferase involved in cell wall biosynthesis|nr:glycosyltransferase family 4 protein [Hyphomonadaceae bacterium]